MDPLTELQFGHDAADAEKKPLKRVWKGIKTGDYSDSSLVFLFSVNSVHIGMKINSNYWYIFFFY